ncbi:alpha/beta fold hydrolase [Vandammella animalimorsus]|uniref:Alpha/beta hydrolase n=1 Tax=Vandammella animalimorsus TaxID=2029117 RepID=A0A2A2B092_9BURK|nr:alpha/beta fold hydrolase [Vandammella animalimorsus]PAT43496.1 alpha/beta hydrolase [Vandammella animalimorsus]
MSHEVYDARRSRYVDVGDAGLFVAEAGDPNGEPLLLLHGGLGDAYDFRRIVPELPQQLRLIALELRGQGRSSRGAAPLRYVQYQADVLAVLDQLQIASARVLGFSDGGIVGYRLAVHAPQRVRALVTVGSQWRLLPDDPSLPLLHGLNQADWQARFPAVVARYEAGNPQPDLGALIDDIRALWLDTDPATGYPGEQVRQISAPVLIACGDRDPYMPLDEALALRERIAGAGLLCLPFAGHGAHVEAKAAFLAAANAFLTHPEGRPRQR